MGKKNLTDDLKISSIKELITSRELIDTLPMSDAAIETVVKTRNEITNILNGSDNRLLLVVGPCSIHDVDAAKDYANRLLKTKKEDEENILVVMRVYFEKPRTVIGWKGLISPQYISDIVSWGAIGARTTESQSHRELASGLSCPVGFKNGTDGGIQIAVDAIKAANRPHNFLSVTKEGKSAIFSTTGNKDCHIILRGGEKTNYSASDVQNVAISLEENNLRPKVMIDASHANSQKDHKRQRIVIKDICEQITNKNKNIIGVMIESNLVEGKQEVDKRSNLTYGQSITDACIGWEETEELIMMLFDSMKENN